MKKYNLPVKGMTCASCVNRVEKTLKKFEGIDNVNVNFAAEKVSFEAEENADIKEAAEKIAKYGYDLEVDKADDEKGRKYETSAKDEGDDHYNKLKKDVIFALVFTIPLFVIAMLRDLAFFQQFWTLSEGYTNKILLILTTPVMFVSGKRIFIAFWAGLKHFSADMSTLVAVGTGAAFGYSLVATLFPDLVALDEGLPHVYFETAGVIITLILFGRLMESRAKKKTNSAIKKLLELKPSEAIVLENGKEKKVKLDDLRKGQTVVIKPGFKIPADGLVISGHSTVDESMLTGESIPLEKSKDSKVIGGTINKNGTFNYRITELGNNSVLGQIIKLVEDAQASKAPIQKLADKIAGVFSPTVIALAIVTFIGWMIFATANEFNVALINFVAVLIIACPCALGLATPTAIMVGTGLGANHGILIKNGESLEIAHKLQSIILDKTGTITEGKPAVTDIHTDGVDENKFLKLIGSIENKSQHPIGEAIVNFARDRKLEFDEVETFENLSGKGITAVVNGDAVLVGNKKLMESYSIKLNGYDEKFEKLSREGKTTILVGINGEFAGYLGIEDPIKGNSKEAVKKLREMGLEVIMLTGDNEKTASAIADRIGIDNYFAEVMPDQKAGKVKEIKQSGKVIAMVGDGINDAPALVTADLGIAIGSGTDVAIESSDITLMSGDLMNVVSSIQLSQKTIKTIKQNLFWAFIYNTLGIPLAALGFLNPIIAALAMSMSSVSVVSNSLRLRRTKAI